MIEGEPGCLVGEMEEARKEVLETLSERRSQGPSNLPEEDSARPELERWALVTGRCMDPLE